ncbi:MAG: aldo/keto reductase [SAR202 cluster bacterium]|nr:aldo/keto reductase [SAR202 cluster bacterium]
MQMTTLGKTGLEVSKLGAGLATIGLRMTRDELDDAGRALNTFLDNGINFLDAAECSGIAHEAIGRFVAHRRGEYVVATKVGHNPDGYYLLVGRPWTAKTINITLDRILKTLGMDHVDILQLHSCNMLVLQRGEAVQALLDLKKAGKTRFTGYSGDGAEALWAIRSGHFDTLQTTFNLVDQRARYEILPEAAKANMGVIIKRPIANAAWGASEPPRAVPCDVSETPTLMDYHQRYLAMTELGLLPANAPADRIALAMGFLFAHPKVHTAIAGSRNPAHIKSNIDILENKLPIPTNVVEDLYRRYDDAGYFWPQWG